MEITSRSDTSYWFPPSIRWGSIGAFLITVLLVFPILVIISSIFRPFGQVWHHLLDTVLLSYIANSLILMFGVALGTCLLGVSSAWLVAVCQFPGRKTLSWILLLPMAMPAYIIAYTYTGLLDVSGPIQNNLRAIFGWSYGDYFFPQIRSLGGATCMLSLVLYPYVYLLARVSFANQAGAIIEASRNLGRGPLSTFLSVSLPMARPAIIAGVSLVMMETLADYGTVAYFGVSTFTTGIFRIWYGLGELATAAQLSAMMMFFVFSIILLEQQSRRRMRFYKNEYRVKTELIQLKGSRATIASFYCWTIVSIGFIIPIIQLVVWAASRWRENLNNAFVNLAWNSFLLASTAAIICVLGALFLSIVKRYSKSNFSIAQVEIAKLGYAIPGAIIAVGVLIPAGWFDNQVNLISEAWSGKSIGLMLGGSLGILIFSYLVRFLSVSLQTLESGLSSIKPSIDESAASLGVSKLNTLRKIHLPLLKTSLLTAFIMVFVDVLKELPTTLILRPFNFNTLAVRTYELASDERLIDAALPALTIVVIGLLPILLIFRTIAKSSNVE